jgi:hypothetical protein
MRVNGDLGTVEFCQDALFSRSGTSWVGERNATLCGIPFELNLEMPESQYAFGDPACKWQCSRSLGRKFISTEGSPSPVRVPSTYAILRFHSKAMGGQNLIARSSLAMTPGPARSTFYLDRAVSGVDKIMGTLVGGEVVQ